MRTIPSQLESSQNNPVGFKLGCWATFYNGRNYLNASDAYVLDYHPGTGYPYKDYPQDMAVYSGTIYTIINKNGALYGMTQGSATEYNLNITCPVGHKPAISGSVFFYIYYLDSALGKVQRAQVNPATWALSNKTDIYTNSDDNVALHSAGISSVMAISCLDGYVYFRYWTSGTPWQSEGPDAHFIPKTRWYDNPADIMYSAACIKTAPEICFYISDVDAGTTYGIRYNYTTNEESSLRLVMPADLSSFKVVCARSTGGTVTLSGKFTRLDDFQTDQVYNLLTSSSDGFNFSLTPDILFATDGLTYQFLVVANDIWGGNGNCLRRVPLKKSAGVVVTAEVLGLQLNDASSSSSATLVIGDSTEAYAANPYIKIGSIVSIRVFYDNSTYGITYNDYLVTAIAKQWRDGVRQLQVSLMHLGLANLARVYHPFYTEMIFQQAYRTPIEPADESGVDKLAYLYTASGGGVASRKVLIDFWNSEPWGDGISDNAASVFVDGRVQALTYSGAHTDAVQSQLLIEATGMIGYPTVYSNPVTGAIDAVSVKIYAWSRTFQTGHTNDIFVPRILVEHEDGTEELIGTYDTGPTYNTPPMCYYDTAAGDYPITYIFNGTRFQSGDKIKRVVVRWNSSYATQMYLERVVLDGVLAFIDDGAGNTGWTIENDTATLPGLGRPYVMFSQRPYGPWTFYTWADFTTSQLDIGASFGVVGHGYDAQNYTALRFRVTTAPSTGTYELICVRNGFETVLSSYGPTTWVTGTRIILEFKGGKYRGYRKEAGTGKERTGLLTHTCSDSNPPLLIDKDIAHVGIYGYINTPKVQICGYTHLSAGSPEVNDGIPILPYQETEYGNFPSSGTVRIDSSKYDYTAKLSGSALNGNITNGPFGMLRVREYSSRVNEYAVDLSWFWKSFSDGTDFDDLLVTNGRRACRISYSAWNIVENSQLLFRSRHWSASASSWWTTSSDKLWCALGFIGLTAEEPTAHIEGAWCFLDRSDSIAMTAFGTVGELDTEIGTIQTILEKACKHANTNALNNNYTASSLLLSDGVAESIVGTSARTSYGFDVRYDLPTLAYGDSIKVMAGTINWIIGGSGDRVGLVASLTHDPISWYKFAIEDTGGTKIEEVIFDDANLGGQVRIVLAKDALSFYCGDKWLYTIMLDTITHSGDVTTISLRADLASDPDITLTNVEVCELFASREAVPIDLTQATAAVVSSIIQERPIYIYPRQNGDVLFSYNDTSPFIETPYDITVPIYSVEYQETEGDAASDGILYYTDVDMVNNPDVYPTIGFITKTLTLSSLDEYEARHVGMLLMSRGYKQRQIISVSMRPDLRIQPGDTVNIDTTLSSTGTSVQETIHVDAVQIDIFQGIMQIQGWID